MFDISINISTKPAIRCNHWKTNLQSSSYLQLSSGCDPPTPVGWWWVGGLYYPLYIHTYNYIYTVYVYIIIYIWSTFNHPTGESRSPSTALAGVLQQRWDLDPNSQLGLGCRVDGYFKSVGSGSGTKVPAWSIRTINLAFKAWRCWEIRCD